MYNDIFVSYFIPTVNSNPHCDTSCLGPMPPICNSVSGCLRGRCWETLGTTENRQEQVEHDRVGCRSLGVLLPQRQVGTWRTAELLWRGKNTGDSPGRTSAVGLEPQQARFCFTPSDPAVLQPGGGEGGGTPRYLQGLYSSAQSPQASPCN